MVEPPPQHLVDDIWPERAAYPDFGAGLGVRSQRCRPRQRLDVPIGTLCVCSLGQMPVSASAVASLAKQNAFSLCRSVAEWSTFSA